MKNKIKIVLFSDLHYSTQNMAPYKNEVRKLSLCALPLLKKLTLKINKEIKPDLVLFLGDSIEDTRNLSMDITNLKFISNYYKKIKPDFYAITGNHDLRTANDEKEIFDILDIKDSFVSFDKNGYHFVMLNLCINKNESDAEGGIRRASKISIQDLQRLDEDLNNNILPTIIAVHYGLADADLIGNWWFEDLKESGLLANRKEVKKILKKHKNILAVFSGHQHWNKHIFEDNINHYLLGSLVENNNRNGIPEGVYAEVTIVDNKINFTYKYLN